VAEQDSVELRPYYFVPSLVDEQNPTELAQVTEFFFMRA
jgi:hypothetical protein